METFLLGGAGLFLPLAFLGFPALPCPFGFDRPLPLVLFPAGTCDRSFSLALACLFPLAGFSFLQAALPGLPLLLFLLPFPCLLALAQ